MDHSLTEKNLESMTAVCAIDGVVGIRSRGQGRFQCAVKKAEKRKAWADRHPDNARANRVSGRAAHRLASFDETTMTGECPVCGTVGVVVKGRRRKDGRPGVMCRNRAAELYPNLIEESSQDWCPTCRKTYLDASGGCAYCDDREQTDVGYGLKVMASRHAESEWVDEAYGGELPHIYSLAEHDPYGLDGDTVANPALKVIGAGVPAGTNPQKFIADWLRQNAHLL